MSSEPCVDAVAGTAPGAVDFQTADEVAHLQIVAGVNAAEERVGIDGGGREVRGLDVAHPGAEVGADIEAGPVAGICQRGVAETAVERAAIVVEIGAGLVGGIGRAVLAAPAGVGAAGIGWSGMQQEGEKGEMTARQGARAAGRAWDQGPYAKHRGLERVVVSGKWLANG